MKFRMLLLLLLPIGASAQMLQSSGNGDFSNLQLASDTISLKKAPGTDMNVFFSVAGDSLFLTLTGSGTGTGTIDKGDEAILTLENNRTLTVKSIAVQGFDSRGFINTYKHSYHLAPEDLEAMSRFKLQLVKKYAMSEHSEVIPDEKGAENLRTSCAFFLEELNKRALLKPVVSRTAPAFPGGPDVYLQFLNRNIKLPTHWQTEAQPTATVEFRVGANGSVSDIHVSGVGEAVYSQELLRILKRMPKWKPALEGGKAVDFLVTQKLSLQQQGPVMKIQFAK